MEEKRNRLLVLLQRLRQIRKCASESWWLDMSYFLHQIFEAYMIAGEEFNLITGDYGHRGLSFAAGEGPCVFADDAHDKVDECIMSIQQRIIDLPYEQDNKQ